MHQVILDNFGDSAVLAVKLFAGRSLWVLGRKPIASAARQLGRSVDRMAHPRRRLIPRWHPVLHERSSQKLIMTHYVIFQPYAWHILTYFPTFAWRLHMELLRRCGRNSFSSATCRSWVSPWYSLQSHFFTAFWDRTVLLSSDINWYKANIWCQGALILRLSSDIWAQVWHKTDLLQQLGRSHD